MKSGSESRKVNTLDVESLYRRYGPMVLRRCRSILGDEDRAMDAMQDVFVKVLRKRESLRPDYPSSLLYRIATNTCLNVLRSRRRAPSYGSDRLLEDLPGREEPADRVLDTLLLEELFAQELPGTRSMAELHYLEKASFKETAARVGLSVSGVRKRLSGLRARGLAIAAR